MVAAKASVLPRLLALVLGCLFMTATITFAAESTTSSEPAATTETAAAPAALVVPDVRGQAYIFAKGMLEDAGFAWKVEGRVRGYAANLVALQFPAPGTRVADNGSPIVTLQLSRNGAYAQVGEPEDRAPFAGTQVRLEGAASLEAAASSEDAANAVDAPRGKAEAAPDAKQERPAAKKRVTTKEKSSAAAPAAKSQDRRQNSEASSRPPAFVLPGAPKEPLDEITLPARARALATWVESHREPSAANVRHWLYQHTWILTGARFGWYQGAEALETLIAVDRRVERLWGVGAKSRRLAETALVDVRRRAR